MPRIISLSVAHLAGRHDIYSCDLQPDTNVFFGLNGSGKTSLLRILRSALVGDASLIGHVPFSSATVALYSFDREKTFSYTIARSSRRAPQPTLLPGDADSLTRDTSVLGGPLPRKWTVTPEMTEDVHWHHNYLPTTRLDFSESFVHFAVDPYRLSPSLPPDTLDTAFETAFKQNWLSFCSYTQSEVGRLQHAALVDILKEVLIQKPNDTNAEETLDWQTAYRQMTSFVTRQQPHAKVDPQDAFRNRYENSPLLRNVVARIDHVERQTELAQAPQTTLQALIKRMFSGPKSVDWTGSEVDVLSADKRSIGLRSLSSGEKQLLWILLSASSLGNAPLLIDEPELSLHIDWQKELLPAIRELSPTTQIIAATHSPEIMSAFDQPHIYKL